jgi:V/A-type H+-transporting ATPase subunit I
LGRFLRLSYLKEESYGGLLGEGSIEIFETVLSVMANVASYIRLLALALAHIALMIVIQEIISLIQVPTVNYNDLFSVISFILIHIIIVIGLIIGNLMVILLEGLLVFLNDMRLHFYEFFFKFYQGAGTEFFPFYLDSEYSIITFEVEKVKDIITEEVEKEFDKKAKDIDKAVSYISKKYF